MSFLGRPISRRSFLKAAAVGTAAAAVEWSGARALAAAGRSNHPVVVIGAGLGGLAAAAYLARDGFPVTVIERNAVPGGYITSFDRGAFSFDVSPLHNAPPISRFIEDCGIQDQVVLVQLPELFRLIAPDHDLILPEKDPEGVARVLSDAFPREAGRIRDFMALLMGLVREQEGYRGASITPDRPLMWSLRGQTWAQVLDSHFEDTRLKAVFSTFTPGVVLPLSRLPGLRHATWIGYTIMHGRVSIRPRAQALSDALMHAVKRHGGRFILNTEVTGILTRNGSVAGVRTVGGEVHKARATVSNACPLWTYEKILPAGTVEMSQLADLRARRPSHSYFVVWLGLGQALRGRIKGFNIDICEGYDPEAESRAIQACDPDRAVLGVRAFDNLYPGYSKPGKSTVQIVMRCGYGPWKRFEADYFAGRKEAYRNEKDRISRAIIERVQKRLIPGLGPMIEVMDAATPLTMVRYTGNPGGAAQGYDCSMEGMCRNPLGNRTPVKGLYLASHWVASPGPMTYNVMSSGEAASKAVLEDSAR